MKYKILELSNIKGRLFVIGDIHGNYLGLLEVLHASDFNFSEDTLIVLGDVVDGWGEDLACIELLLKIKNLHLVLGNHDDMFIRHLKTNKIDRIPERTITSFLTEYPFIDNYSDLPTHIQDFFDDMEDYIIIKNGKEKLLFVHGGFNRHFLLNDQPTTDRKIFCWDRDLYLSALAYEQFESPYAFRVKETKLARIFIGHTPTIFLNGRTTPITLTRSNITNLDTGSGFANGKITMMNVKTNDFYQSTISKDLYPDLKSMKE